MIDTNPRLPIVGSINYEKQLNARLYEVLRQIAVQMNSMLSGQVKVVTTTEKNALKATEGLVVFDSTLGKLSVYTGASWETVTSV